MSHSLDIWKLLAGLAIFLFGMFLMENALKVMSGKTFRRMIRHYTNGRLRAIASGTLTTALLQSSSAVSLMVLAFVGAGVMSMENGIGVIMGSNLGTTFTAWLVATFGFKIKIESLALPLIAISGLIHIAFGSSSRLFQLSRLFIGIGFLFLGLDFMKTSVETAAQHIDLAGLATYGPWLFVLAGLVITALMQSSSASIAIVLTALHGGLLTFPQAAATVIGANIGTTITVLLGSIGASQAKKRVSVSHLAFNLGTGLIALIILQPLVGLTALLIDIEQHSVMALALFHTLFNALGVIIFIPLISPMAHQLLRTFPEQQEELTIHLGDIPTEVTDAATDSLRKETIHLFDECLLYNLRILEIDVRLVLEHHLPFEKMKRRNNYDLYERIKMLHGEIFEFYARLLHEKLDQAEATELERLIYASRNIMNAIKNFKGMRHDLAEFGGADNDYIDSQYKTFRRRFIDLCHDINRLRDPELQSGQYQRLLRMTVHIEQQDKRFIQATMQAATADRLSELEIGSLLLVNRLFSQACRLLTYALKDLLLDAAQVHNFDHALDMKEIIEEERASEAKEEHGNSP